MEVLIILLALAYASLPIYLMVKVHSLEKDVRELKRGSAISQHEEPHVAEGTETGVERAARAVLEGEHESEQSRELGVEVQFQRKSHVVGQGPFGPGAVEHFIEWIQKDFLVKLGAFLLLLGIGWFVSYAFLNNWIGPMGRIALGLTVGAGIMALGAYRIRTYLHQGGIFMVLGGAVVIMTIYAAREIYDFFTPLSALVIMFATALLVALTSIRYENKNLALASLILASAAPLFTAAPAPDVVGLFAYIMVVVLGTLWVVALRGWDELVFASLVVVFFYSLPFLWSSGYEQDLALLFSFAFTAIFFVANLSAVVHRIAPSVSLTHVMTALGTTLYLIVWISSAAPEEWMSLLYVSWMLVFSVGAFLLFHKTKRRGTFYVYSAAGVVLLGAATAAELSGPALTIAYTLEAGALVALSAILLKDVSIVNRVAVVFIVPILLSFESIDSKEWRTGFMHEDFFVLVVLILTLGFLALFLHRFSRKAFKEPLHVVTVFAAIGGVLKMILIWLVLHSVFGDGTATTISLLLYTIGGLTGYIFGKLRDIKFVRVGGALVLGFVVLRLLLVEVWDMDLVPRIITFIAIGTLLISTAFIGRKNNENE